MKPRPPHYIANDKVTYIYLNFFRSAVDFPGDRLFSRDMLDWEWVDLHVISHFHNQGTSLSMEAPAFSWHHSWLKQPRNVAECCERLKHSTLTFYIQACWHLTYFLLRGYRWLFKVMKVSLFLLDEITVSQQNHPIRSVRQTRNTQLKPKLETSSRCYIFLLVISYTPPCKLFTFRV